MLIYQIILKKFNHSFHRTAHLGNVSTYRHLLLMNITLSVQIHTDSQYQHRFLKNTSSGGMQDILTKILGFYKHLEIGVADKNIL
jgi:hypothetical protein